MTVPKTAPDGNLSELIKDVLRMGSAWTQERRFLQENLSTAPDLATLQAMYAGRDASAGLANSIRSYLRSLLETPCSQAIEAAGHDSRLLLRFVELMHCNPAEAERLWPEARADLQRLLIRASLEGGTAVERRTAETPPAAELLSAADIAKLVEQDSKRVDKALGRFAETHHDCRIEVKNRKVREARWLYRTKEVWPILMQHLANWRSKDGQAGDD